MCGSNSDLGTFLGRHHSKQNHEGMALCQDAENLKVAIVSIDVLAAKRR